MKTLNNYINEALIGKYTKIQKPAFETILEGFSFVNTLDERDKFEKGIEDFVKKFNTKSENLKGPFIILSSDKNELNDFMKKNISQYCTDEDWKVVELFQEMFGAEIWDKYVDGIDGSPEYVLEGGHKGGFIFLAKWKSGPTDIKNNDIIFFIDKSKMHINVDDYFIFK